MVVGRGRPDELRVKNPVITKTTCDAFYRTERDAWLTAHEVGERVISSWATDFSVVTTIRVAASRAYDLTVIGDGHTASDRSPLDGASIIEYNNSTWADLIVPGRAIRVVTAEEVIRQLSPYMTRRLIWTCVVANSEALSSKAARAMVY